MTQPTYSYSQGAHDAAAGDITAIDALIQAELNDCDRVAMQHFADWVSHLSKDQYDQRKATWNQAVNAMNDVLGQASPTLNNIHENYTTQDMKIQKSFM